MGLFQTLNDTVQKDRLAIQAKFKDPCWGVWVYDPKALTLAYQEQNCVIPLDEIADGAELLDWIFQVRTQTWAGPQVVVDLLEALDFILAPRVHFGTQGMGRSFDVKTHLERFNQRLEQARQE